MPRPLTRKHKHRVQSCPPSGKPFNPILGETFQGEYPSSGTRVYAEQISHHPPTSAWQLVDGRGRVRQSYVGLEKMS